MNHELFGMNLGLLGTNHESSGMSLGSLGANHESFGMSLGLIGANHKLFLSCARRTSEHLHMQDQAPQVQIFVCVSL